MARLDVATLAKSRAIDDEQLLVIGAVRLVTIQAVLCYRRMFPQERATLVCMAFVAILVHGRFGQEFVIRRAVRVVAVAAFQFAFAEGHVRGPLHLCAPLLVTLEAGLELGRLCEEPLWRGWLHDLVTVHAGYALGFMRACFPV